MRDYRYLFTSVSHKNYRINYDLQASYDGMCMKCRQIKLYDFNTNMKDTQIIGGSKWNVNDCIECMERLREYIFERK